MAEPTPITLMKPEPPRSFLIQHILIHYKKAAVKYALLASFWRALTATMPKGRPNIPLSFPTEEELAEERDYALLAFCREDSLPDHAYAYVYIEHDVVGIVAFFQSPEQEAFAALQKRLPPEAEGLPALGQFVTLGAFTDQQELPKELESAACDPTPLRTAQGFSLWHLKSGQTGLQRLFASVPNAPDKQRVFQQAMIGPEVYACPSLLQYQIYSAKVYWMAREFDAKYRQAGLTNLRHRREIVEAELDAALLSDAVDMPTLLLQQQKAGGLTLMHRDLKEWLITLRIAADKLERLHPRAKANGIVFDLYRHDQERIERLRAAIETEMGYIETNIDRMTAAQSVYAARFEQQRFTTEILKNYHHLVQNSILSGVVVGLAAIQASSEYHYPELRWPLVAFIGALGFALPILALRRHETDKRGVDHWAWAVLAGTFGALAYSYLKELMRHPILPPPLWDIGLVGALVLGLVYRWQNRRAETKPVDTVVTRNQTHTTQTPQDIRAEIRETDNTQIAHLPVSATNPEGNETPQTLRVGIRAGER